MPDGATMGTDQLVNELKGVEARMMAVLHRLAIDHEVDPEPHGLSIATAHFELGFLELFRAVIKPEEIDRGWALERSDSDPDEPLFWRPSHHVEQWTPLEEHAVLFSTKESAETVAASLAIECRVVELAVGAECGVAG